MSRQEITIEFWNLWFFVSFNFKMDWKIQSKWLKQSIKGHIKGQSISWDRIPHKRKCYIAKDDVGSPNFSPSRILILSNKTRIKSKERLNSSPWSLSFLIINEICFKNMNFGIGISAHMCFCQTILPEFI